MNDLAYQELIYNKLLALDAKMARIFPYTDTTPELKGGTRARIHPLPGITMETYEPATLAVGGQIKDMRYREPPLRKNTVITQLHGGAKPQSRWIQFVKEFSAKHNIPYREALKKAGDEYRKLEGAGKKSGKISRAKKARKWLGFTKDAINTGMDLGERGLEIYNKQKERQSAIGQLKSAFGSGMEIEGAGKKSGKISRRKKARKWLGFTKDAINTGMDLGERGLDIYNKQKERQSIFGSGVEGGVLKKLEKEYNKKKHNILVRDRANVEQKFKDKIIPMTLGVKDFYVDLGKKAVKKIKGGSRKPSNWIAFVKEFSAKHGIPYNQALKLAGPEYKKIKG